MKTLLFALAILITTGTQAQKLQKAQDLLKANKLTEAKTEIDNFLNDPKNAKDASAWYTKSKIYLALAGDPALGQRFPVALTEAFAALTKYTEYDDKLSISLQIDGYKPVNDIYTGFYQQAATSFNNKQYQQAFDNFRNAIKVSSFMSEKGWIQSKLDTTSVLYAGVSAEKLNRPDDAALYYGKLVEAKAKGESFVEIYKWVANYHYEKKNDALAQKFVSLGKEVYPSDPFWASIELDMIREKGNKDELFKQYEKTIATEPSNHLYHYNYAVELYQHSYNTDESKRPANSANLIQKADAQVNQAVKLKPDYARAQLFAGQIKYNLGVDQLTRAKAITETGGEAEKTKTQLKANALQKFDEAIPYFVAVEKLLDSKGKLSLADKADLKEAFDLLINIYNQKKMMDKVKEYEFKFNDVDKKH